LPIEAVTHHKIGAYIDALLKRRLAPKTINCHLITIRRFYDFLISEQELNIDNPVRRGCHLRQSKPLPRHLRDSQVSQLLSVIANQRDRAIFMLMLRSGLRVAEVVYLTTAAIDWHRQRLYILNGKGGKHRVVYISPDTLLALQRYLKARTNQRAKRLFLVERGRYKGKPISIRGVQKRIEAYGQALGLKICCHQLRHYADTRIMPTTKMTSFICI